MLSAVIFFNSCQVVFMTAARYAALAASTMACSIWYLPRYMKLFNLFIPFWSASKSPIPDLPLVDRHLAVAIVSSSASAGSAGRFLYDISTGMIRLYAVLMQSRSVAASNICNLVMEL